ncbi:hypothetical protein GE21DRAFT_4994 [Neurospora crassa]|uniref:Uncharacterized protein n=1 Tax=Neurospora crassa (strain ATCC 24698 / 74-OR23-1A / CBS 708.71 / DSM 1257 / FGSC 987) TaxID=367110 RepID=Q7S3N0_NEUCR|nr:hypothetical protein NCU08213 [Neurospora crassa OR74A]EAA30067.1 hypothetical protein NCU08213 [Neurospora crassa OR74A]KHE86460.1 hypothetical protein GE21DRAFT_4994 [Neurospora crassa]|eukprot:XP_959303.1 hypothetical protein NCU08213 [Neurospora crassa OR74A]
MMTETATIRIITPDKLMSIPRDVRDSVSSWDTFPEIELTSPRQTSPPITRHQSGTGSQASYPPDFARRLSSLNQSINALQRELRQEGRPRRAALRGPVFSESTPAVDIQLPDPILLTPTTLGISVDENRTTRIPLGVPAPTAGETCLYRLHDRPGFCDCPGCRHVWGTEDGADRGLR